MTQELHRRHRRVEFGKFLRRIDAAVPAVIDIHLVLDTCATNKTPALRLRLTELTTKRIRRGTHRSTSALERDLRDGATTWNADGLPVVWEKDPTTSSGASPACVIE